MKNRCKLLITGMLLATGFGTVRAQEEVVLEHDSLSQAINNEVSVLVDSARIPTNPLQIYNRKYWKLPLVYGGFIGCLYAMNWNNTMYKDYSQAYIDIMDNDPGTQSYNQFLHNGATINGQEERYKKLFKQRKDRYRRWRDMSFFVLVGVYALSVIDAYVDAELSVFDISKDLSLSIEPTILDTHTSRNPLNTGAVGVQCNIKF